MKKVIRKTVGDNISDSHINKSYEMDIGVVDMILWIILGIGLVILVFFNFEKICEAVRRFVCWLFKSNNKSTSKSNKKNVSKSKDVPISKKDAYQFMELLEALDELNHSK